MTPETQRTTPGPMERYIIAEGKADRFYDGFHATALLNFARSQDDALALLLDLLDSMLRLHCLPHFTGSRPCEHSLHGQVRAVLAKARGEA